MPSLSLSLHFLTLCVSRSRHASPRLENGTTTRTFVVNHDVRQPCAEVVPTAKPKIDLTCDRGAVLRCWNEAVQTMAIGERAYVTCDAPYAYGPKGRIPTIGKNARVRYELQLVHAHAPAPGPEAVVQRSVPAAMSSEPAAKDEL